MGTEAVTRSGRWYSEPDSIRWLTLSRVILWPRSEAIMNRHADHNSHDDNDRATSARFKRECWPFLGDVLRTARFLTHDPALADDLVQETMLKAFRAIDSFKEGTNAKAWLLTILRRTHVDWLRSTRHHSSEVSIDSDHPPLIEDSDPGLDVPGTHEQRLADPDLIIEQIGDDALIRGLKRLPEAIRWTLLLVDVEQIEHRQAAEILGVPVGTIKSRCHRGRSMLRQWLLAGAKDDRELPVDSELTSDPDITTEGTSESRSREKS